MNNKIYISSGGGFGDDFLFSRLYNSLDLTGYVVVNESNNYFYEQESVQYQINRCDIFIFILSFRNNPLSFFELGYASALSKEILIITENEEEVPSFLKKYRYLKLDFINPDFGYQLIDYLNEIRVPFKRVQIEPKSLTQFLKEYVTNPNIVDQVSEDQFLQILYREFNALKYSPMILGSSSEYGYDMILEHFNGHKKAIVEVKKYSYNSKVSINIIQQLVGALTISTADAAIVITTSKFTNSAIDYSQSLPFKIYLWDIDYLLKNFTTQRFAV